MEGWWYFPVPASTGASGQDSPRCDPLGPSLAVGPLSSEQLVLDESSSARLIIQPPCGRIGGRGDRQEGHARLVHGLLFGQEGLLSLPIVQVSRGVMASVIHPGDDHRRSLSPNPVSIDAQVIYRLGELIALCTRSVCCWASFPTRPDGHPPCPATPWERSDR